MGVSHLWGLLDPASQPVRPESLQGSKLAIDASIWLYQFQKAMRDSKGETVHGAHLGTKPIFVFDGKVPDLKRKTIQKRRDRREKAQDSVDRTAAKLLENQLKIYALKTVEFETGHGADDKDSALDIGPYMNVKRDEYELPENKRLKLEDDGKTDLRMPTEGEITDFIDSHRHEIDLDKVNINSEQFKSLSLERQHEIILSLKNASRAPSQARVQQMVENSKTAKDFSLAQITNLIHRSALTDRYHSTLKDSSAVPSARRVAGLRQRDFVLTKNEDEKLGWGLEVKEQVQKSVASLVGSQGFTTKKEEKIEILSLSDEEDWNLQTERAICLSRIDEIYVQDDMSDAELWKKIQDLEQQSDRVSQPHIIQPSFQDIPPSAHVYNSNLESYLFPEDPVTPEIPVIDLDAEDENFVEEIQNFLSSAPKSFKTLYPNFDTLALDIKCCLTSDLEQLLELTIKRLGKSSKEEDVASHEHYLRFLENILKRRNFVGTAPAADFWESSTQNRAVAPMNNLQPMYFHHRPQDGLNSFTNFDDSEEDELEEWEPIVPISPPGYKKKLSPVLPPALPRRSDIFVTLPSQMIELEEDECDDEETHSLNIDSKFNMITKPTQEEENISALLLHMDRDFKPSMTQIQISEPSIIAATQNQIVEPFNSVSKVSIATDEGFINLDEPDEDIESPLPEVQLLNEIQKGTMPANEFLDEDDDVESADALEEDDDHIGVPKLIDEEALAFFADLETAQHLDRSELIDTTEKEQVHLSDAHRRNLRDTGEITSQMIYETQDLLKLFGIPFIVAPMEAESQCAFLMTKGLIDGIVTDDSDVFLFGGDFVYKNFFNSTKFIERFTMGRLKDSLGLERHHLIQMALLLGSDYTAGIKGLGPVSSTQIVNTWSSEDLTGLEKFRDWVSELQIEGPSKDDSVVQKKLVIIALMVQRSACKKAILPEDFPNAIIADAYKNPEVDEGLKPFVWGEPQLEEIRSYLGKKIMYSKEKTDSFIIPVIRQMFKLKTTVKQPSVMDFFPIVRKPLKRKSRPKK